MSYLIVTIIPIMVLGIYSYTQSRQLLNDQAKQSIERNISTAESSIAYKMELYNNLIQLIVANRLIQDMVSVPNGGEVELSTLANQLREYLDPYFNMMLTSYHGIDKLTIYTESPLPEYGDYLRSATGVSDQSWYREALRKFGIRWYFDESQQAAYAVSKFPETFLSGHHVLYVHVDVKSIFMDAMKLLSDYGLVITDSHGTAAVTNARAAGWFSDAPAGVQEEGISTINGIEFMVINKKIPNTGWTIHCYVPIDQVSGNAAPILYATFIVIGICIAILLIIISLFANGMLRRIYRLNHWMKRVENGGLELKIHNSSKDEIGELTDRFGNMLFRIRELIQEVRQKELHRLQAQMNPHFLYNTLSSINWKALQTKSYEISRIVTSLSKYYRTALNKGDHFISVKNELENVKSYLDIMLITDNYGFDVMYDIDNDVNRFDTINMILQPLVENAIKHGVNRKTEGKGIITISATLVDGNVQFAIMDNGPGMEEELIQNVMKLRSAGYGLRNVQDRIELFFGHGYGITVRGHGEGEEGTTMLITVPQIVKDANLSDLTKKR
ncbi:cache domain-containing sensor histidine kinase [Paenibacillus mendelii]|uniref:histidine kinase n=1 Tax=Paenibacillus mendelii TaxID=206163 RepID=A0ABV6J2Y8_9BACL|nr:sensor histidine kinase [Paenibacillus mendelii]MCQ6563252.1 histidine kinase [Paenibacillus mendelii]